MSTITGIRSTTASILLLLCLEQANSEAVHAQALLLKPDPANNTTFVNIGAVDFTQIGGSVKVVGKVWGLQPGPHGFHVHENGNIGDGCKASGPHFNPTNSTHGAPSDSQRHVGDLGNIDVPASGMVEISMMDDVISLHGPFSIIGRSLVVHEGADDYGRGNSPESKKSGNAGARIACGVIGILEEAEEPIIMERTNGAQKLVGVSWILVSFATVTRLVKN